MSTERTLAMQKNFKKDLDTKYNDIFRNLYVQWKLQSKKKYEELQSNGLANSGVGSKTMYTLMEELINKTIEYFQWQKKQEKIFMKTIKQEIQEEIVGNHPSNV